MEKYEDEAVYAAILQVRENWSEPNWNYERTIRSLGYLLFRCSDKTYHSVLATILEAQRRHEYLILKSQ